MDPRPQLYLPKSRRAGFMATVLAHAAIVAGWQLARKTAPPEEVEPAFVQWVRVQEGVSGASAPPAPLALPQAAQLAPAGAPLSPPSLTQPLAGAAPAVPAPLDGNAKVESAPATPSPGAPGASAREMIELARRDAGAADRALRKESDPRIVAPLDSPYIRMANKFREAAALAPNRWYEAPKVVELVNDGGDGARRFRVLTALGIYCITERSPATSIDMIEKHGKQRITNCGHEHEQPANPQQWRTARD